MPRGSHFSCFAKKGNPKKATPTIGLFLRCSEKSGTKYTRYAQTVFRSDRFFPPLLGANQRGPFEPIFDRFAIGSTKSRLQLSGPSSSTSCLASTDSCPRSDTPVVYRQKKGTEVAESVRTEPESLRPKVESTEGSHCRFQLAN